MIFSRMRTNGRFTTNMELKGSKREEEAVGEEVAYFNRCLEEVVVDKDNNNARPKAC